MCNACTYKQYCQDCMDEQEPKIEVSVSNHNNGTHKNNHLYISDSYLHHKGRAFHISRQKRDKRMKQKLLIETKEGFIFHVREIEGKLILTKIVRIKPQKAGRPECPECQKIFIGTIPSELLTDNNW